MRTIRTVRASRIAATGVVLTIIATALLAATGVAVAKSPAAADAKTANCKAARDDSWPSWVQGRPSGINPNTTAAIYMWHDGNGWHIRVTHHTTNLRTFRGELTTQGSFTGVKPVQLEKSDQFQVSNDKRDVTFRFDNYGRIDGLNFFTHCAPSISFSFQSDGATAPSSKIVIGNNGVHPASDPFVISR
jgi:hypothetical protein